jgi:hypothetical protein
MPEGVAPGAGYPDSPQTGTPIRLPGPLDPLTAHRTRTNTRISLEPIGYDSHGAPLYAWQLDDEQT